MTGRVYGTDADGNPAADYFDDLDVIGLLLPKWQDSSSSYTVWTAELVPADRKRISWDQTSFEQCYLVIAVLYEVGQGRGGATGAAEALFGLPDGRCVYSNYDSCETGGCSHLEIVVGSMDECLALMTPYGRDTLTSA